MDVDAAVIQQIAGVASLLVVAAVALTVARRIHVPFTVAMLVSGFVLGQLVQWGPDVVGAYLVPSVSPELILFLFLPALIFEPAFQIDLRELRRNIAPVFTLAVPGLLLSVAIIGGLVWWLTPLDLGPSLLLGSILSALDPVAVVALYRRLGVPSRITAILEGESLLGGAGAIVVSRVLVGITAAGAFTGGSAWQGLGEIFVIGAGGAAVGWAAALVWGWLLARSEGDPFVETALTTALAYASYLLAELVFGVSGVMATLAAGLTLGVWGRTKIHASVEAYMEKFWDFAAAVSGALLFLLLGLKVELAAVASSWDIILAAIAGMMVARAAALYLLTRLASQFAHRASLNGPEQGAIFWGGLRGAFAAALVLSLGNTPFAPSFVAVVTAAILFSVLVQGLTLESLVRVLGLERRPLADRVGRDEGLATAMRRSGRETPELKRGAHFSTRSGSNHGAEMEDDLRRLRDEIEGVARTAMESDQERSLLLMRCFEAERAFYDDMFGKAHLSERAYRDLRYSVVVQAQAVRFNEPLPQATLHLGGARLVDGVLGAFDLQRRRQIANDYETAWGRFQSSSHILGVLDELAARTITPDEIVFWVRAIYEGWQSSALKRINETAAQFPEFVNTMQGRMAERLAAQAESEIIESGARDGSIPAKKADAQTQELAKSIRSLRGGAAPAPEINPVEALRKTVFFMEIPEPELERIAQVLRPKTIPDYQPIPGIGPQSGSMFVVGRGIVQGSVEESGEIRVVETWGAGEIFGNTTLLGREAEATQCRAISPCVLYALRARDLEQLRRSCPGLNAALDKARADFQQAAE